MQHNHQAKEIGLTDQDGTDNTLDNQTSGNGLKLDSNTQGGGMETNTDSNEGNE